MRGKCEKSKRDREVNVFLRYFGRKVSTDCLTVSVNRLNFFRLRFTHISDFFGLPKTLSPLAPFFNLPDVGGLSKWPPTGGYVLVKLFFAALF